MRLFFLLPALLFALALHGQTLHIRLTESNNSPVIGASVRLLQPPDSTLVWGGISDTSGWVKTAAADWAGKTLLAEVSAVGFEKAWKGIKINRGKTEITLVLAASAQTLSGVTVKAKKPLMRQEEDKTIVDPEPIANTSTNAYEILEKTPGLFLDQEGNVYLNSATPATIYINGREQRMSAADLAGILKSLPPGSIERLEILRTPSAKYDASGSGGIVNVVLKKGVKIGRTGSAYAGMNQGRLGNRFAGFTLNNSEGNRTSNLNVNFSHRNSYDQLTTIRQVRDTETLAQDAYTVFPANSLYMGYSLSIEPSKKWEFTFDGRGNYNRSRSEATNNSFIERTTAPSDTLTVLNDLKNRGNNLFAQQGARLKYTIDTLGSEWTTDLSFQYSHYEGTQDFVTGLRSLSNPAYTGAGDIANNRHFLAAQTDLKYKFPRQITVETGLKTTLQRFDNATDYSREIGGVRSEDPFRTNAFIYREAVHAAYFQTSKTVRSFVMKTGVRMENTQMNGQQRLPEAARFKINRTDWFPYAYLSHPIMKIAGFPLKGFLIYRRSITRPTYDYLNPFPRFLDQFLYEAGNPRLRPQFTQNFEFNISMEDFPILAVGRNQVEDIFTNVVYSNPDEPLVAYRTYDNLGKNQETYFRFVAGMPPGGKFFFVVGGQYNHNRYEGFYENAPLMFTRGSWSFFTYQQLKIDSRSTLSLNGFWRLRGQLQFYELSDFGGLNINVNRTFLDRKLTITLSANDVFFTNRNDFRLAQGSIVANGSRQSDTRRFGLNVRYNFGLKKREEKTGNPFNFEQLERAGN